MTAHTPGPWYAICNSAGGWGVMTLRDADFLTGVQRDFIGYPYGASICSGIGDHTEKRTSGNEEANARLIAAAPELLAALEWMVAHDDTNEGDEPLESLGGQTWSEYNAYWLAGLEQARKAIAKAKGEQP